VVTKATELLISNSVRSPRASRLCIVTPCRAIFTDILDFCARVLAIQGGKGRALNSASDPGHGSAALLVGPRAVRFSPRSPRAHERARPVVGTVGGPEVMRPRCVTGTSRRTRIGWPPRVLGARRPRMTSGPPAPRPRCPYQKLDRHGDECPATCDRRLEGGAGDAPNAGDGLPERAAVRV
jgi:hypothetical protein